ncbi:hypothetical protein SAMN06265222_101353 [Neorhodopirellula lusitana]|uniref:Uncharacterized protein n=1 Tax=Neorhodopirellula lusitana TaxID=445327 RepID=A0ABY1PNP2_9BACT|nr:hypothetical protein SAMN06265222_101353 [Neorhodopirellula lusitana]
MTANWQSANRPWKINRETNLADLLAMSAPSNESVLKSQERLTEIGPLWLEPLLGNH